ncbi:hypothetical protein DDI_0684 [Dickeya dianthicola RNS04.9]|nr:hypothetical protein DDI_0684 [Dickeya dianthicola RNS04.9]
MLSLFLLINSTAGFCAPVIGGGQHFRLRGGVRAVRKRNNLSPPERCTHGYR